MHVSYAELIRIGPEAIRMTGFTFGQADDALEGIVWTECVLARGYDLLRMANRRRPDGGWPRHAMEVNSAAATVEFPIAPAYAFAARLADLATDLATAAADGRAGMIEAHGTFGGWIAPYIAYRLARNRRNAAVFWRPGRSVPADEAPAMLAVAVAAGPDGDVAPLTFVPAGLCPAAEKPAGPRATLPRHVLGLIAAASGRRPGTSMLAIAASAESRPLQTIDFGSAADSFTRLGLSGGAASVDASNRLRAAVDIGIEVAPENHDLLVGLSHRIRLPNTERSKSQAG
jgi:hypothetical protein